MRPFRARFNRAKTSRQLPQSVSQVKGAAQAEPETPKVSSGETALERFERELTALGGAFTRCQAEELPAELLRLLKELKVSRLQAWSAECLPAGLLDELHSKGIQIEHQPDPSIQAGLTGALGGIAETGTLVIHSGPGRPQTASLLPEIHFAVLHADSIMPDLPHALASDELRNASNAVLVSGPSRTADIEMTLTIGVHGPRQLHVICI